ncbi:MAG TPA: hypothetical protein VEV17_12790 [Bryobacteraceae bacterium]|nr:hypothetical protein [Bryobacteraceae bacterium]
MSKRLQILLPDHEMAEIQSLAKRELLTASEWARLALRPALASEPVKTPEAKLRAIRRAVRYSFPIPEFD